MEPSTKAPPPEEEEEEKKFSLTRCQQELVHLWDKDGFFFRKPSTKLSVKPKASSTGTGLCSSIPTMCEFSGDSDDRMGVECSNKKNPSNDSSSTKHSARSLTTRSIIHHHPEHMTLRSDGSFSMKYPTPLFGPKPQKTCFSDSSFDEKDKENEPRVNNSQPKKSSVNNSQLKKSSVPRANRDRKSKNVDSKQGQGPSRPLVAPLARRERVPFAPLSPPLADVDRVLVPLRSVLKRAPAIPPCHNSVLGKRDLNLVKLEMTSGVCLELIDFDETLAELASSSSPTSPKIRFAAGTKDPVAAEKSMEKRLKVCQQDAMATQAAHKRWEAAIERGDNSLEGAKRGIVEWLNMTHRGYRLVPFVNRLSAGDLRGSKNSEDIFKVLVAMKKKDEDEA